MKSEIKSGILTNLSLSPDSFQTFGELLKYVRRRARLTQLELSIAVGYSEAQIGRLEKNQRRPDLTAIQALFMPALHLDAEPQIAARFLELAQSARQEAAPTPGISPYKGLLFFDESDSDLFFGRETLTARLAEHVMGLVLDSTTRFLAVVGASGSGKSSLVRAGLAVTLKRAGWDACVVTPTAHPVKVLTDNLDFVHNEHIEKLLIVVDQFEEIFTLCRDEIERITFIQKLIAIASDSSKTTTVVITLRADFYSHCAQYPLLRQAVATEQEYMGQMTAEELRRAIEEPARCGGWEFEPGLVDVLLNDIGAQGTSQPEPGALPLLSHALLATWENRRGRTFTLDGYHASGGVRGAIAETAESIFNDQLNQAQREIAREIFLRLTELGEGTEDTRRRATLNELVHQSDEAAQLRAVLNILAEARLITLNENSVEVAHEALIREWQRLHEWLTDDREGLLLHRHLTESAQEWKRRGQDRADLYRGARLAQAQEWTSLHKARLNRTEQDFIAASIEAEQHEALEREAQRQRELETAKKLAETEKARAEEQTSSLKRLRQRGVYLVGALVLTIVAAALAGVFARNSQQQAFISSVRELSSAANTNLEVDPERSILLALQAVNRTYAVDHSVLPEAEDALHRAVQASRIELTLRGHKDVLWSAVFSPDDTKIATASADGTAKIWDARTGKDLLTVKGSSYGPGSDFGIVWYAAFSPDGKLLGTAGGDGSARLWDTTTGQQVTALKGHFRAVFHIEFSPDGKRVTTISGDGIAKVWDVLTGRELLSLNQGNGAIPYWLAFSPDGSKVAIANTTSDNDGWISFWDANTGQMLLALPHQHVRVNTVSFSPDGTRIMATCSDQTIRIWDARDGKELLTFYGYTSDVTNAVYSPDGSRFASVLDNQVRVWDAKTGQELLTLAGHTSNIITVASSPDGTRLVTASRDKSARIWNIGPSREFRALANGSVKSFLVGASLIYSPTGTGLAVTYSDSTVKIWDPRSGKLSLKLAGQLSGVSFIAYSSDGTRIATANLDGTAKIWDVSSGRELLTLGSISGDPLTSVAFSPNGSYLATASYDKGWYIWDVKTGKKIVAHTGAWSAWSQLDSIAFSPDGLRFATSSFDNSARVWDAQTGNELLILAGHPHAIRQIVFSPDGTRLATASDDSTLKIWDASSGKELLTLSGHTGNVYGVAFNPDGKAIASASGDKTAKVWDAQTGRLLLTLRAPDGLTSVAFSPNGSQLAVVGRDGTARIYLLRIDDLIALARQRVTRSLTTEECQQYLHVGTCPANP